MKTTGAIFRFLTGLSLAILLATDVAAQSSGYSPVTNFDAYGNARHRYENRSSFGTNPVYRAPSYSPVNSLLRSRRSAARQGFGFSESASTYGFSGRPISTARSGWFDGRGGLPRSFQQYGGFGSRLEKGGDIATALTRKQSLIQATSLVAPVHRAMVRNSTFGDPLQMAAEHPFVDQPTPPTDDEVSLEKLLTEDAATIFDQSMAEGWESFVAGQYRLAARSFQAAATMQPENTEPQIAQVFCYAALGAMKSAASVLPQIAPTGDNFFLLAGKMDMESRFTRAADIADVSIQTRLHVADNPADANAAALNVVIQWFLNRRSEAQAAASALSRSFPTSVYANWPSLLKDEPRNSTSEPVSGS